MSLEPPSSNGQPGEQSLPPVTPPSPGFILQLFLVPGLLVAVVVAFIWVFFGWIGGGPQTAEQFVAGLKSGSEVQRWKTAEQLAQILKRDDKLASNVELALQLTEILQDELKQPAKDPEGKGNVPDMAAEFLPATLGSFNVPVAMPLFQEIIRNHDPAKDAGRLRRRSAVWAMALLGERMQKYDEFPAERKQEILSALQTEAGPGRERTGRQAWAQAALDYLEYRDRSTNLSGGRKPSENSLPSGGLRPTLREHGKKAPRDPFAVSETLAVAARSDDEMTRKLTVLALAVWKEQGAEKVLFELAGPNEGIVHFEDEDHERGVREIRYNAALALARIGSSITPKQLVLEALNETKQRELHASDPGRADRTVVAALQAIGSMRRQEVTVDADIEAAVERLAQSPNPKIEIEARRILGTTATAGPVTAIARENLLVIGLAAGVLILLAVAVFARWRRKPMTLDSQVRA